MSSDTSTIVISGDKDVVELIRQGVEAQPGARSQVSERKNLDGNTASWFLVATLAAQTLPHVLGLIKEHLASKRIKRIKLGDMEIENPTAEDVERFRAALAARSGSQ
jgi:hypothetical protein